MQDHQREFLAFVLEIEALRFGSFVLKSGRTSPYFFNTGLFDSGQRLARLGSAYARAIQASGIAFDMLFGPAYKGIPLVAAVASKLYEEFGRDIPYAFNRKEAKDHGEGGMVVGAGLNGRVLVVDDVISAGTSVRESQAIISAAGADLVAVAIALDRQERGTGERSAIQEVREDMGVDVVSIVDLDDIVSYLEEKDPAANADTLESIRRYRTEYGV